jgi:hypothetical protein
MELRFRPTVQGAPFTPLPMLQPDTVRREGGWLLFDLSASGPAEAPSELYLREFRDTDPRDLDSLTELCSVGMIRPVNLAEPALDLPTPIGAWQFTMDTTAEAYGLPPCPDIETERRDLHARDRWHRFPVHVTEAAYRVKLVRDATDLVLAYAANESVPGVDHEHRPGEIANDDDLLALEGWRWFAEITNPALRDFHPYVDTGAIRTAPLYGTALLQLINDLTEQVPYLTCGNENCRRVFARQRGRSEYGGHRMRGVQYCTNYCARAQYQREKRRRDRRATT